MEAPQVTTIRRALNTGHNLSMQSLNYIRHLEQQIEAAQDTNKSQRTKALLMYNTAVVLERSGIASDLVAQVCALTKVSRGTFYTYFKDSITVVMAVMMDFLQTASGWVADFKRKDDLYDSMVTLLQISTKLHAENGGLFRCLYVINPQNATNRRPYRLWQKVRHEWRVVIAQQMAALMKVPETAEGAPLHLTYALTGMADDLLFQIYVADNPFFKKSIPNDEYLIELLAVLWYRSLLGKNPPTRRLKTTARAAARLMQKAQSLAT